MAVRIRMKVMGRKHRQFFRIVAIDSRQPRDGRVLEELGTYDPQVRDKDKRVTLSPARIKHWLSKGALASERCTILFNKFMQRFEEQDAAQALATAQPAQPAPEAAPAQ